MFSQNFGNDELSTGSVENFEVDRVIFCILNQNSVNGCSANKIHRNILGIPVAVGCNCGKTHRVISDSVFWITDTSSNELRILKMVDCNLLKAVWITEL